MQRGSELFQTAQLLEYLPASQGHEGIRRTAWDSGWGHQLKCYTIHCN